MMKNERWQMWCKTILVVGLLFLTGAQLKAGDSTNLWSESLSIIIHNPDEEVNLGLAPNLSREPETLAAKFNRLREAIKRGGGKDVPILIDSQIADFVIPGKPAEEHALVYPLLEATAKGTLIIMCQAMRLSYSITPDGILIQSQRAVSDQQASHDEGAGPSAKDESPNSEEHKTPNGKD